MLSHGRVSDVELSEMYDYIATLLADAAVATGGLGQRAGVRAGKDPADLQARVVLDIIEAQSVHTLRSSLPQPSYADIGDAQGISKQASPHPAHQAGAGAPRPPDRRPAAQLLQSRRQQQASPRSGAGPAGPAAHPRELIGSTALRILRGARSGHRRSPGASPVRPATPTMAPPTRRAATTKGSSVMVEHQQRQGQRTHTGRSSARPSRSCGTGVWNIANIWLLDISVQERG